MKTKFVLETYNPGGGMKAPLCDSGEISIIGTAEKHVPYVAVTTPNTTYHFIKDKDLEKFAINILKAMKSKHLKP